MIQNFIYTLFFGYEQMIKAALFEPMSKGLELDSELEV